MKVAPNVSMIARVYKGSAIAFRGHEKGWFPQGKLRFPNIATCNQEIVKILMLFNGILSLFAKGAPDVPIIARGYKGFATAFRGDE